MPRLARLPDDPTVNAAAVPASSTMNGGRLLQMGLGLGDPVTGSDSCSTARTPAASSRPGGGARSHIAGRRGGWGTPRVRQVARATHAVRCRNLAPWTSRRCRTWASRRNNFLVESSSAATRPGVVSLRGERRLGYSRATAPPQSVRVRQAACLCGDSIAGHWGHATAESLYGAERLARRTALAGSVAGCVGLPGAVRSLPDGRR